METKSLVGKASSFINSTKGVAALLTSAAAVAAVTGGLAYHLTGDKTAACMTALVSVMPSGFVADRVLGSSIKVCEEAYKQSRQDYHA